MDSWEVSQKDWTRTRNALEHFHETLNSAGPSSAKKSTDAAENTTEDDDEIHIRLLCGGDLLESFAKPGLWADEDLNEILGKHGLVSRNSNFKLIC